MATVYLSPVGNGFQWLTTTALSVLAGGKINTYLAGTVTPAATFTDMTGTISNGQPIILDASGRATNEIWFTAGQAYKFVITDASNVVQFTLDNLYGINDPTMPTAVFVTQVNLADTTNVTFGDALVGFKQSNASGLLTGAIGRTVHQKLQESVSVLDFGADPTGVTDSTTAMQAAHNTGSLIYYPAGTYKFSTITMTAGGMRGDGTALTILISTDTSTADLVTWNGVGIVSYNGTGSGPIFDGMQIQGSGSKTGGGSIALVPSVGEVNFAYFHNLKLIGGWIGIRTVSASHWRITDCIFINYLQAGVFVQNTNDNDSGDSTIEGCLFNCGIAGQATQAGVFHSSSGGLRVVNNKFLGGAYGYLMNATMAKNIADVHIVANSIENQATSGIAFSKSSGAFAWNGIVIIGNEMGGQSGASSAYIVMNDSSAFLGNVLIQANIITNMSGTQIGLSLDYTSDVLVQGNKFSGSAGTPIAIANGTHSTGVQFGVNKFAGTIGNGTYSLAGTNQSLSSGTTQSGTLNITTSGAYGGLFSGSGNITFPIAYTQAPVVEAGVTSGAGGGIVANVVSTTATTAALFVVGQTNSGVVPIFWQSIGRGE